MSNALQTSYLDSNGSTIGLGIKLKIKLLPLSEVFNTTIIFTIADCSVSFYRYCCYFCISMVLCPQEMSFEKTCKYENRNSTGTKTE